MLGSLSGYQDCDRHDKRIINRCGCGKDFSSVDKFKFILELTFPRNVQPPVLLANHGSRLCALVRRSMDIAQDSSHSLGVSSCSLVSRLRELELTFPPSLLRPCPLAVLRGSKT
jgi:hypothetical protein